jgi:hypothetical protein
MVEKEGEKVLGVEDWWQGVVSKKRGAGASVFW